MPAGNAQKRSVEAVILACANYAGHFGCQAEGLPTNVKYCEILDLRSLAPLDGAAILNSVRKTKRLAVFDIGWEPFGLAAEVARIVSTSEHHRLDAPLLSIARRHEHTPASCFLEEQHYANEEHAVKSIRALVKGS